MLASSHLGQSQFGSGIDPAVASWNLTNIDHGIACGTMLKREINCHSMSGVKNIPLRINNLGDIMATMGATTVTISTQGALPDGVYQAPYTSGGASTDLAGAALLFAGAASVGSILLGPMDGLRGKSTPVGGGGGGGGGSGGNSGGPVGDKYQHSFESINRDRNDKEEKLGSKVSSVPRPYEVSRQQSLSTDIVC
jgi:hypothetical protein